MDFGPILLVMSAGLLPVGLVRALHGRRNIAMLALALAFGWFFLSGCYFAVFLQLGGDDAAWLLGVGALLAAVAVTWTLRRSRTAISSARRAA